MRVPKDVAKARKVALALKGVKIDSFEDKRRWLIQAVRDGLVAKGYKVDGGEEYESGYQCPINGVNDIHVRFDVIRTGHGNVYARIRTSYWGRNPRGFREPKSGFWPDEFVEKITDWVDAEQKRMAEEEKEREEREKLTEAYAKTTVDLKQFAASRKLPVVPEDEGLVTGQFLALESDADGITVSRRFTDGHQAKRFMAAVAEWWEDETKREGA